jgi:RimJ/RimL family protein N-acetyltransferase
MIYHLASEKDFNAVYDLYMDESSNPYLTYDPMSREAFQSIYNGLLKTETLYVVEKDNEIIATYRLIPKSDRQAHTYYLGGFAIRKKMQGQGLGKEILSAIKKSAIEKGKKRIELTVDINNMPAIALYEKMGFLIEGVVRKSYRVAATGEYYDEFLMALIL